MDFFKSRVIPTDLENTNENFKTGKISIVVTTNRKREEVNLEKLNSLIPDERTYKCESSDRALNISKTRPLRKDLSTSETGQLPTNLQIKKGAPVLITANHHKAIYKEDGIMNGSRGYIDHIQTNSENPDEVEIIWVVFNNPDTGAKY